MRSDRLVRLLMAAWLVLVACDASARADDPAAREGRPPGRFKLLTWNIQMLPTFPPVEPLRKMQAVRAPWIVEFLNAQDYDVVVLQEVIDHKMTELLKDGLRAAYPHIIFAQPQKKYTACSGGVLFASRIPIKYVDHIAYKSVTGIDGMAEKGCVLVEGRLDGIPFQIAGTHLQAGDDEARNAEVPEIYQGIIGRYKNEGVPQLLVGDMNIDHGTDDYRRLLEVTQMRDFPLDDEHPFTTDGLNSWNPDTKRAKRIDHVLLNPRGTTSTLVRQTVQRARREHQGQTIDLADHYGVVAEVQLEKAEP